MACAGCATGKSIWVPGVRPAAGDRAAVASHVRFQGRKTYVATGTVLVEAPRDQVWEVLRDYENAHLFMPQVIESHVMERTPDGLFLFQKGEWTWGVLRWKLDATFRVRESRKRRLAFENVAGDFLKYEGFWHLGSSGLGRTRVDFYAVIRPDFFAPRFGFPAAQCKFLLSGLRGLRAEALRRARQSAGGRAGPG